MKYPRTFHFPFSPEIHSDDKTIDVKYLKNFIGRNIVITEKLDWGNTCITQGGVFARSHSEIASHASFSPIKALWAKLYSELNDSLFLYWENLTGIHSIEYTNLTSNFYLFSILQNKEYFNSWNEVENFAKSLDIPVVPVIFKGQMKSIKELEIFLCKEIDKESFVGGEREGFVVRIEEWFSINDMDKYIAKYVRKWHVQDKEHWSKNWKQAKIIGS